MCECSGSGNFDASKGETIFDDLGIKGLLTPNGGIQTTVNVRPQIDRRSLYEIAGVVVLVILLGTVAYFGARKLLGG